MNTYRQVIKKVHVFDMIITILEDSALRVEMCI